MIRTLIFLAMIAVASADELQCTVSERIGKRVEWRKDSATDTEISGVVHQLLRQPLTADRAVQIALLNNRSLQASFEEIGLAQADLTEAGLLKNPVFAASIRFPDRPPSATNAEFSVVQDFLDVLMIPLRKKVAANNLALVRLRVGDAVLKLASEVKAEFYTFQAKEQLASRLAAINGTNVASLELFQRQHEAGNVSDLDLANQQATYSQARLDAAQLSAEIHAEREKLNRLMGLWGPETQWKAENQLPTLPTKSLATAHLESLAINQRLDLAASKSEVLSLVQSLGLTKTYRYVGAIEFGVDTERQPDRQRVTGPTLRLELPLFNQGQGRVAKLEAQLRQAERRLESDAIAIRSDVREARDRLLAKKELAAYYRDELVPERNRILQLTLTNYNSMLKGPYDLLLAKQNELTAERGFIEALRDYWIAYADLERAVGGSLTSSRTRTHTTDKETH